MMEDTGPSLDHASLSVRDFGRLSRFIYDKVGIKMPDVKRTMLEARLQKRLRALGLERFSDYCDYLFSAEGMAQELVPMIDMVTTNKTDFFREPDHFDFLTQRMLPDWVQRHPGARLSIWSAGCSSGEEPYTLAMVLSDFADANPGFDFQILATDISTRVLDKAKNGIYAESLVDPVPQAMKKRYLLRSKDRSSGLVRIVPELREKIRFQRLNFMEEFGLREQLDVIFCRNVIIYFDRPTQEGLLQRFHRQLKPGGFIFMGHSETLSGLDVALTSVYPTVYRKLR